MVEDGSGRLRKRLRSRTLQKAPDGMEDWEGQWRTKERRGRRGSHGMAGGRGSPGQPAEVCRRLQKTLVDADDAEHADDEEHRVWPSKAAEEGGRRWKGSSCEEIIP